MKIAIIGPGIMPIPPHGWGAVESLIWDYAQELKKRGHEIIILNTTDHTKTISTINDFNPDFVHLQYDDYHSIMPHIRCNRKAATSHYGYLEQYKTHPEYNHILYSFVNGDFNIFCLSEGIKNTYASLGVEEKRLFVTPNGARADLFNYEPNTANIKDRSIYLAKIDFRKRQAWFQTIEGLDFAGNCVDGSFNTASSSYLGEWSKEHLYANLTTYSNLVLLSDGEADPLVTKEALICGLGLVISEYATANLDLSLPFIDVIPEAKINDIDYVSQVIKENRIKSRLNRAAIREYGLQNFKWENLIDRYIQLIQTIQP